MNFLADCYHPANFLILRQTIRELRARGHSVFVCGRRKDVLADLVRAEGLDYTELSAPRGGPLGRVLELLEHDLGVLRVARREKCTVLMGASVSVAHAARLIPGARSIVFNDDDDDVVPDFVRLAYPFATWVITPSCLPTRHGRKHVVHESYHALAYLHPDVFTPDKGLKAELGLLDGERVFVLRFVSLTAFHDDNAHGLRDQIKRELIERLSKIGRVFVSCEGAVPPYAEPFLFRLEPSRLHSLLAYSDLLVSDSQTMTSEAAVLGTPSIRCNTFVGRISYLRELEERYGLSIGIRPESQETIPEIALSLILNPETKDLWRRRRDAMLSEKRGMTRFVMEFLDREILR